MDWEDRVGELANGRFIFRCKRQGHAELTRTFDVVDDACQFRTEHDITQHGDTPPVAYAASATIGSAADALIEHLEMLVIRGRKDEKTVKDYRDIRARLTSILGAGRTIESIDLNTARLYVNRRLSGGIRYNGREVKTGGARVLKELKFLERLARESGVTLRWSSKKHFEADLVDDVPKSGLKSQAVDPARVVAFINHLIGPAKAFVLTKALTVMRNEELYNLRVGDVDLNAGLIRYVARAKRKRIATAALIPPELRTVLEPLITNRLADAWLFTCRGRKVKQSSFRRQFLRASAVAGLGKLLRLEDDRQLGGVSWIRHAVMTALRPKVGVDAVSKYANHSSVTVTESVYDLDREALELKGIAVDQVRKLFKFGRKGSRPRKVALQKKSR